ncbi:hypothetical protein [Halomonas sp. hl-4]|uniref:hypothetical protein n=1 Tax=Halomonas sp. hl-4 TaxID=1761789 RepID=UPI0012FE04AE|nr:hypothetical protein [Halomonas sp. hl-4]
MVDYPIKERVPDYEKGSKRADTDFFLDLKQAIFKADKIAKNAVKTFQKIRGWAND